MRNWRKSKRNEKENPDAVDIHTEKLDGCLFLLLLFFYIYPKWAEWDRSGQARAAREENWYFQHFYFIYFLIWHFHHSASTLLSLKAICFSSRFSFASFFFFFNRKLNFLLPLFFAFFPRIASQTQNQKILIIIFFFFFQHAQFRNKFQFFSLSCLRSHLHALWDTIECSFNP